MSVRPTSWLLFSNAQQRLAPTSSPPTLLYWHHPSQQQQQIRWLPRKPVEPIVEEVYVPPPPRYAVVNHAEAYQQAMVGPHGQQLQLALVYGQGKDDPDYDPFLEEEMEERRRLREQKKDMAATATDKDAEKGGAGTGNPEKRNITARRSMKEDKDDNEDDNVEDGEEEEDDDDGVEEYDEETRDRENEMADLWKINKKIYNNDGSLKRNPSELAILRAGAPAGGFVAIIKLPASQYKVTTEDLLIVNKLMPIEKWSLGSVHTLKDEDVLLLSSNSLTLVGMPYVPGAEVDIMVEEITQDARVIVFKKRRRKNSKRKKGFRRDITMLRIMDIRFPPQYADHEHMARPDPAPLVKKSAQAVIDFSAKLAASQ